MTGSDEIKKQAMSKFGKRFGENGTFRLISSQELKNKAREKNGELFCKTHDYVRLTEVAQEFPSIQEIRVTNHEMYLNIIKLINDNKDAIPLFVKNPAGYIALIDNLKEVEAEDGSIIAYLGKPMDFEDVVIAKMEDTPAIEA
jgi:hypothetical protein